MLVSFSEAVDLLNQGRIVAIPTETVYGLAARIDRPHAIESIFVTKGRPRKNPLIVHVYSLEDARHLVQIDAPHTQELIDAFWPGSLTLILKLRQPIDSAITAGLDSVAIRCPSHPLCRQLLQEVGPLVAPSANPSGRPSPSMAQHVLDDYDGAVSVLDGGRCAKGVESTIIACNSVTGRWDLARLGAISPDLLEKILGYIPTLYNCGDTPICPGQKWQHYSPKAKLLPWHPGLMAPTTTILGFSDRVYEGFDLRYYLGRSTEPQECLQNLYSCLRQLDKQGIALAAVDIGFPRIGLARTLAERLEKAIGGAAEVIIEAPTV